VTVKLNRYGVAVYGVVALGTVVGLALGAPPWTIIVFAIGVSVSYTFVLSSPRWRQLVKARTAAVVAESRYEVRFADEELTVYVDGVRRIDDAFLPQPWWLLADSTRGCTFPSDARGWQEAMKAMSGWIPGFDHEAVVKAGDPGVSGAHPLSPSPHLKTRGGDPR